MPTTCRAKFAGIAAALAVSQKQAAAAQDGVRDVQGQQKSLQSEQQGLQSQQKALEGKLNAPALAVVSDSLVQQIARGLPYAAQVDALAAIGADPARVAILRQGADKGVPTAKALGESFDPLADPLAATDRKAPPGAGFMARMEAGFFSLVSVRNTTDTAGSSAASKVSRIQADLAPRRRRRRLRHLAGAAGRRQGEVAGLGGARQDANGGDGGGPRASARRDRGPRHQEVVMAGRTVSLHPCSSRRDFR